MLGMRVLLIPVNPTVGDVAGNAARIEEAVRAAVARTAGGVDLIALPELVVSGYPPKDLINQEGFVEACVAAADGVGVRLSERGGVGGGAMVVIGTPMLEEGEPRSDRQVGTVAFGGAVGTPHPAAQSGGHPLPLHKAARGEGAARAVYNSLLVYRDGRRVARYDKRLLPTYDVFDEDRYFEPGSRAVVVDVPVSRGSAGKAVRVGLAICEDLWKGEDAGFSARYAEAGEPVAEAVRLGASVILSPSASPFVVGKGARHERILQGHAERHGVWVLSINQLGGNDDLVFDGHAMAFAPGGALAAAGENFSGRTLEVDVGEARDARSVGAEARAVLPSAVAEERQLWSALVLGTRDYCRKTGFKRAILGLSGGIDSALTAVIASAALGPEHVIGVLMPTKYSSEHSVKDAEELAKRLGVRSMRVGIEGGVEGLRGTMRGGLSTLGQAGLGELAGGGADLADENLQSRVRGTVLMTLSNRTGAIVLTTGNKSELAVGYCTLYGDMNGGLAVLSDVTKHWVYRLANWCNSAWRELGIAGLAGAPIPASSLEKPPSAELRPNQTDQDSLPAYDTVDEIVRRYVEGHQSRGRIERETGLERSVVERVTRLIDLSEYKRKQAALGLKVTSVAFGSGRRWPIAQGWRGA